MHVLQKEGEVDAKGHKIFATLETYLNLKWNVKS